MGATSKGISKSNAQPSVVIPFVTINPTYTTHGGQLKTYHIECMETNSFIVELEARDEEHARELAHADINSHEVVKEWVSDWEINLVEEVA